MDRRIELNTKKVIALRDLLLEIAANPVIFADNEFVIEALGTQGAIAKFTDNTIGIHGTSLSTVKRITPLCIDGGFPAFDRLRLAALHAILSYKNKSKSNKLTKTGLAERVRELERQIQQNQEDLFSLTFIVEKCLSEGRNYAKSADKPVVLALCIKEQRELRDMMSLIRSPLTSKGSPNGNFP